MPSAIAQGTAVTGTATGVDFVSEVGALSGSPVVEDATRVLRVENLERLFAHADELQKLGRPEEALSEYGDLFDARLGGAETLIRRAFLFRDLKRFKEAKLEFERAAELEPWNCWPLLRLAQMLQALGKSWQAVTFVEQALHRQPDMAELHINAAVIFTSLEWFDRAFAVVRSLPSDMEDWWGHVRQTTEADYRRRHKETIVLLKGRRDEAGWSDSARRDLAVALLRLGRAKLARQFCEAEMRRQLRTFTDFELYARVIARESGLSEAIHVFRTLRFLYEDNAEYARVSMAWEEQLRL